MVTVEDSVEEADMGAGMEVVDMVAAEDGDHVALACKNIVGHTRGFVWSEAFAVPSSIGQLGTTVEICTLLQLFCTS